MTILLAAILGAIQGLTEFLPISSSGHLVAFQVYLAPYLGMPANALAYDVLLHSATFLVTVVYLRDDILRIVRRVFRPAGERERRFVFLGFLASVPSAIVGFLWKKEIESSFSSMSSVANEFIITALLLEIAHRYQLQRGRAAEPLSAEPLGWEFPTPFQAIVIGLSQAVAILPAISRSGATIAAGLLTGMEPVSTVRFSFFISVPAVFGAILLEGKEITALSHESPLPAVVGFLVSLVLGWLSIRAVPVLVSRLKLRWFAIYTLVLGILLHFA